MTHSGTRIFAHRGANREAAENTRSAFDKALQYAIDGMETDVQLSRDEVPVLWHDRFLNKLGLSDRRIDDFDYSQLRSMNFAGHFAQGAMHEGIMSLKEFLDAYRKRCQLLLEIKSRTRESSARRKSKVMQTLEMAGAANSGNILISSFHLASLVHAHRCRPEFPLIYNFEARKTLPDAQRVLSERPFLHGLCLPIATLTAAMVALLHNCGKSIIVYTCNSDSEINKALELGVDILISDCPQQALRIRDA